MNEWTCVKMLLSLAVISCWKQRGRWVYFICRILLKMGLHSPRPGSRSPHRRTIEWGCMRGYLDMIIRSSQLLLIQASLIKYQYNWLIPPGGIHVANLAHMPLHISAHDTMTDLKAGCCMCIEMTDVNLFWFLDWYRSQALVTAVHEYILSYTTEAISNPLPP